MEAFLWENALVLLYLALIVACVVLSRSEPTQFIYTEF